MASARSLHDVAAGRVALPVITPTDTANWQAVKEMNNAVLRKVFRGGLTSSVGIS